MDRLGAVASQEAVSVSNFASLGGRVLTDRRWQPSGTLYEKGATVIVGDRPGRGDRDPHGEGSRTG